MFDSKNIYTRSLPYYKLYLLTFLLKVAEVLYFIHWSELFTSMWTNTDSQIKMFFQLFYPVRAHFYTFCANSVTIWKNFAVFPSRKCFKFANKLLKDFLQAEVCYVHDLESLDYLSARINNLQLVYWLIPGMNVRFKKITIFWLLVSCSNYI